MKKLFLLLLITISCIVLSCNDNNHVDTADLPHPPIINYTVLKVYPHDTSSFTQGLVWHNNAMYEGTGRYGFSKLVKVKLENGKAIYQIANSEADFGEGITIFNNKIYQLTWREHKVYVYDVETFKKVGQFSWPYEGWGITHNGKELIISTGSSNLYFVDPVAFTILKSVGVSDNYGLVSNLNELEYVDGYIYANRFEHNIILKINPQSGKVEGVIDLENIFRKSGVTISVQDINEDVLNGIAYDSAKKSFYITGKQWPALFEVRLN